MVPCQRERRLAILGFKGRAAYRQQRLLDEDLLRLPPELPIGPEDTRDLAGRIRALPLDVTDAAAGLRAIVAIHRGRGAMAAGGERFRPYYTEAEALTERVTAEGVSAPATILRNFIAAYG